MIWDEVRWSNDPDRPTMLIKHLVHFRGWKLDLHKMIGIDSVKCFHTHPATAFRLILWGGYWEECFIDGRGAHYRLWMLGSFGIVKPELAHRIHYLLLGVSYSLWIRAPKTHEIQLLGDGWNEVQ